MGLEIIPIVALVGIMLFSGPGKKSEIPTASVVENKDWVGLEVEAPQINDDLDTQTIYKFITSRYKRIPTADAQAIAKNLVEYGKQHQIDPKFTAALMSRESGFNRQAVSSAGAKGLGQIKDMNYPSLNIKDPFDIKENASGTTVYIKQMLKNWKNKASKVSLALASYFKGYTAVKNTPGLIDDESKKYVSGIMDSYQKLLDVRKKLEKETP